MTFCCLIEIRGNLVSQCVTLTTRPCRVKSTGQFPSPSFCSCVHKLNLQMKFWELPAVRMDEVTKELRAGG